MQILIKATTLELTPSLKKYIDDKMKSLDKFINRWEKEGAVIMRVEIARTTRHHHKGEVFYAEANLDFRKKILRAEANSAELHAAVDEVHDEIKRQIEKLSEKIKKERKRISAKAKIQKNS